MSNIKSVSQTRKRFSFKRLASATLLPMAAVALIGTGCDEPKANTTGSNGSAATQASSGTSSGEKAQKVVPAGPVKLTPASPKSLFYEITGQVGLEENPPIYPDGTFKTPEITPGGILIFDYNNDGLLDLLVVRHPPPGPFATAIKVPAPSKLYRQEKDGKFTEVPGAAGINNTGFGHGGCVGDFDNDGFADVYITNYGKNKFFHNNGDGTFTDWTEKAGLLTKEEYWSSACSFLDYDGDGFLDLYVVTFADFEPERICQATNTPGDFDYCGPHTFKGQHDILYHNKGDGTFVDVSVEAGIREVKSRGWGIVACDLTGDGLCDVFIANDEEPNQLFVNQGDKTGTKDENNKIIPRFKDEAPERGCNRNRLGNNEANMGTAVGDTRRKGKNSKKGNLSLFISHIVSETATYFEAEDEGQFYDKTEGTGTMSITRAYTGWGIGFLDYDNDGWLDLAIGNGRVSKAQPMANAGGGRFWSKFAEPNLLFKGDGTGKFVDVSKMSGSFTGLPEVHRGLGFADLYDRGAIDMVCVNLDNTVRVYRNDSATVSGNHYIQVLPMLAKYKREALGAKVYVTSNGLCQQGACIRAYSYLASNDPRVHFGLGKTDKVDELEIHWPSGEPKKELFEVSGVDKTVVVKQGTGKALK